MKDILKGKITAITGGATGIGRAIAIGYIEQGAKVAVNHLGDDASLEAIKTLRNNIYARLTGILSIPVGVLPRSAVDDVFLDFAGDISRPNIADYFLDFVIQRWGRVDVLVANAGIARFHPFLSTPDAWIGEHLAVNVGGCYFATRAAGRAMRDQPGGASGCSVIGIASISALCGSAELVHYTPTKAAVLNLMQSAAVALGPLGIRCNALLPGTIETQLNEEDLANLEKRKAVIERTTLKKLGVPRDLAGPAVFLASDLSTYCSGAQILVDGGLFVNQQ